MRLAPCHDGTRPRGKGKVVVRLSRHTSVADGLPHECDVQPTLLLGGEANAPTY